MNRKICYWKLREAEIQIGVRTLIMGVLNVTPDSFSDGGKFSDPDRAYARALELEEQGADIIDLGAESTRPGSHRISADEEWQRLVPVLKRLRGQLRVPLSLDTYKSEIAQRAFDYGVEIINDPTGLTFDPGVAKAAANANAGLILNHMRGQPDNWAKLPPLPDPVGNIGRELEATVNRARHAGVDRARIVIDPGIGFGKRGDQNSAILAHLGRLAALDYPLLIGVSRKSFLAQTAEIDMEMASAAAVAAAILNGADIVRVHDVKRMRSAVLVADEIAQAVALELRNAEAEEHARIAARRQPVEMERPRPVRPRTEPRAPVMKPVTEDVAPPATETATPASAAPSASEAPVEAESPTEAERPPQSAPPATQAPRPSRDAERSGFRPARDTEGGGLRPPRRPPAERRAPFERRESSERKAPFEREAPSDRKAPFDRKPPFERKGSAERKAPFDRKAPFERKGPREASAGRTERPRAPRPPFESRGDKPRGSRPPFDSRSERPRAPRPPFDSRRDKPDGDKPRGPRRPFEPRGDKPGGPRRTFEPRGEQGKFERRPPRSEGPPERRGLSDRKGPSDRGGPSERKGPPPKRPFRKRP